MRSRDPDRRFGPARSWRCLRARAAWALVVVVGALAQVARAEPPTKPPAARVVGERELVDDDGYRVRLSLPTLDDVVGWQEPGLRIALGVGRSWLVPRAPARKVGGTAFRLRVGARVDALWSLALDFDYEAVSGDQLSGLRFAGIAEAAAHPWRGLSLGAGLGYGGFVLSSTGLVFPTLAQDPVGSFTVGPSGRLAACSGSALVSVARAEYLWVAGPLFASGPFLEGGAQFTRCETELGLSRETGTPLAMRQWWLHRGATLGWWFSWR